MADRFQRLYALPYGLYSEGCPVVIEAGALLKDSETGSILVQIKMRNIGEKPISSCKTTIKAFENNGNEVEGISDFSYLDLDAKPGEEFGSKTPVYLPDVTTRKYSVGVSEVVMNDGTVIRVDSGNWRQLPTKQPIQEILDSQELIDQFSKEIGCEAVTVPKTAEGLFLCACGTTNLGSNHKCYKCFNTAESLQRALNIDYLKERIQERKELEEQEIRKQEALKAEKLRIRKEKKEKTMRLVAVVATIVLITIISIFMVKMASRVKLPTGVHFGDPYSKVLSAANRASEDVSKEGDRTIYFEEVWFDLEIMASKVNMYGYEGTVCYEFDKEDKLMAVLFEPSVRNQQTYKDIIKQLEKEYGKASGIGRWDLGNGQGIHVYHDTVDELVVLFYSKP